MIQFRADEIIYDGLIWFAVLQARCDMKKIAVVFVGWAAPLP
jgi:hypothetical protein